MNWPATSALHRLTIPPRERTAFRNGEMRKLNHEHIFDIPLRTDGALSEMLERVTSGLDRVGDGLRRDKRFCAVVKKLGRCYLEHEGPSLIHGDLFPGSLLQMGSGQLRVIDPEFSFCGNPEFDIGVFYAHLLLSRHEDDPQASGCRWLWKTIRTPSLSSFNSPAWKSCAAFSEWPNCLLPSRWKPSVICSNEAAK